MKITLLGIILFCTFGVFGQTFLGKRHFINVGTAISPTVGFFNVHADDVKFRTDYTIFPSKIELEYGVAANQTTSFSVSGFYRGLPNSEYTIEKNYSNGNAVTYSNMDQYRLATDLMNVSLNLRLHTEYAPIGPYVKFSVGYNRTSSMVYPTLNKTTTEHYGYYGGLVPFPEYSKLESWKEQAQFINIGFGLGKSQLISKNWYVDYGVQLAIFLNFYKPDASKYDPNGTPEELKETTRVLTQKTAAANALSSNLFQFYVKFGFTK